MRRIAALALVLVAASPAAAAAQVSPVGDGQEALATLVAAGMTGGNAPSCLERPMAMRATLARVTAGNPGEPWNTEVPTAAWPALELLADQVAHEVRSRLGARDGELATPPDSTFQWRRLGGHVHVTAYRQGPARWWLSGDVPGHAKWKDTSNLAAERLLGTALDSVLAAGAEWWPAEFEGDSLAFLLRFSWPIAPWFSPEGQGRDPLVGAVARIEVPTYTPVAVAREPRIAYPSQAGRRHGTGRTTGRGGCPGPSAVPEVEARGIEPRSETGSTTASTRVSP